MEPVNWKRENIEPADILTGIKTIYGTTVWTHPQTPERWQPAETLYGWAASAMTSDHEFGWDIALSYAKRAVCRRIDGFLHNNWLAQLGGRKYPEKIAILREIGIPIPGIVQRLVIETRNEIEHDYRSATREEAVDAIDLAHLMLTATAIEVPREPVVVAGGTIAASQAIKSSEPRFEYHTINDLGADPIVFVDFLESPTLVKLVYPADSEIRFAKLNSFRQDEAVELVNRLRSYPPSAPISSFIKMPKELLSTVARFQEFKQQTGI